MACLYILLVFNLIQHDNGEFYPKKAYDSKKILAFYEKLSRNNYPVQHFDAFFNLHESRCSEMHHCVAEWLINGQTEYYNLIS